MVKKNAKLGLHGGKNAKNRVRYLAFGPEFNFVPIQLRPRNLLTTTRLKSICHLIINSGDSNSEINLNEVRH